jgi:hypothetical protein
VRGFLLYYFVVHTREYDVSGTGVIDPNFWTDEIEVPPNAFPFGGHTSRDVKFIITVHSKRWITLHINYRDNYP